MAVLGCGIEAGYPAGHVGMLSRIAEIGLVVSEYPPAQHRSIDRTNGRHAELARFLTTRHRWSPRSGLRACPDSLSFTALGPRRAP